MTDTIATKTAGSLILLALAAEFGAIGLVLSHGVAVPSFTQLDFSTGDQLVMLQHSRWAVEVFSLGVLAPCLMMLVWPGMYQMLAPGGPSASYGVIVSSLGFVFAVVGEAIRLSVVMTLAPAYVDAADSAKPAIVAIASTLGSLLQVLRYTSVLPTFAVGTPLIAIAIIRGRNVPSWLGWVLLLPSALLGYIGGPLLFLGHKSGGFFLGVGFNLFFLWFLIMAIVLLRWRPSPAAKPA